MPSGTNDFALKSINDQSIPITDLGEQASRLLMGGGFASRSGRVMLATGFEGNVDGAIPNELYFSDAFGSGGGSFSVSSSEQTWQGNKCGIMTCGSTAQSQPMLSKRFLSSLLGGRFGFELMFRIIRGGTSGNPFEFGILLQNKQWDKYFDLRLHSSSGNYTDLKLQTIDAVSGSAIDLLDLAPSFSYDTYHLMKLVVDYDKKQYVQAIFDGQVFDLSSIPFATNIISSLPNYQNFSVFLYNMGSFLSPCVAVDNLILTSGEP